MQPRILSLIVCPCQGKLVVKKSNRQDSPEGHIAEGELKCQKCGRIFSIRNGIPYFASEHFDPRTRKNFGYSWQKFADIYVNEKNDFLDWLYPIEQNYFKGKTVLDAGCGNGLHGRMAAEFGAKEVFCADISSAVKAAYANTKTILNVHVLQADIYQLPFADESFDYVYSIGVIQHLPEREKAIGRLARMVKKGGALSIWVYGHEGTFWVRTFIEPIRRFLSILHPQFVFFLAYIPAMLFYWLAKFMNGFKKIYKGSLFFFPLGEYFAYMGKFPFKYQFNTVFDQVIAPRTHYFSKKELETIFARFDFAKVIISERNKMSWRVFAKKEERQ